MILNHGKQEDFSKGKSIMKEVNTDRFKADVLRSSVPVVVVIWGVG